MKNVLISLCVLAVASMMSACGESPTKSSANSDQAAWQQYKAKKAQDELSAETAKQKAEK